MHLKVVYLHIKLVSYCLSHSDLEFDLLLEWKDVSYSVFKTISYRLCILNSHMIRVYSSASYSYSLYTVFKLWLIEQLAWIEPALRQKKFRAQQSLFLALLRISVIERLSIAGDISSSVGPVNIIIWDGIKSTSCISIMFPFILLTRGGWTVSRDLYEYR